MTTIIIKDSKPNGESRTTRDRMLQDSGWGSSFHTPEDADKCAYVERKLKKVFGADDSQVAAKWLNRV